MRTDDGPFVCQTFQGPCGIGGTGGGERDRVKAGFGLGEFPVILIGSAAVAEYGFNGSGGKDLGQVVGDYVANTAVRGTADLTAVDHIPQGDVMAVEKSGFLLDGIRRFLVQNGCQDFPKPILGMVVKKLAFPGFDRGERTENQDTGKAVIEGRNGMLLYCGLQLGSPPIGFFYCNMAACFVQAVC